MPVEDLISGHTDEELDEWALSLLRERASFYDSVLGRTSGVPAEWGFMDSERHPLHALWSECKFADLDWAHPGGLLEGPCGSDWRAIASSPHSVGQPEPVVVDRRACPVLKHSNLGWDSTLRDLSRVGRPSGSPDGEFLRPEGEWLLDLVREDGGERLLEAAHVLAHSSGGTLLENVARIHACLRFGLPVFVGERLSTEALGVRIVASADARRPSGVVPVMELGEGTELILFAGVHTEPHPKSYDDPDSWLEVNRWSCEPSLSCLAGFEYPSFVCKSPIVSVFPGSKKGLAYMVPVACMLPMSDFGKALSIRVRSVFERGGWGRETYLDEWMSSGVYARLLRCTPPLPCRDCLRLNTQAEGHPLRPKSRRPDSLKSAPPDVRAEWEEYDEKMDRIFKIVDRAACYAEGLAIGHSLAKRERRARRARHNRCAELENRIASLERRARRYDLTGNVDKAVEHRRKARELAKKLEELRNGLH